MDPMAVSVICPRVATGTDSTWGFAKGSTPRADGIADVSHAKVAGKWALKEGGAALPAVDPTASVEADAIVAHMKAWATGSGGKWVSMGVPAVGDYGLGEGLFFSVPVTCEAGSYKRIGGVSMSPEVASTLEASRTALAGEAASL